MNCPSCGSVIADGSSFCFNCGAPVAQPAGQAPTNPAPDAGYAAPQQPAQPAYAAAPQQPAQPVQPGYAAQPAQPVYGAQPPQQPAQPGYYASAPAGQPVSGAPAGAQKSKVAAGILGILLGSLGIHKFYLGYTQEGLIMILVALIGGVITLGVATGVMGIIGLVEGIMYLTKSDDEFYRTYELGKKGWF